MYAVQRLPIVQFVLDAIQYIARNVGLTKLDQANGLLKHLHQNSGAGWACLCRRVHIKYLSD